MAVTQLDPFAQTPVTIVPTGFAVTAAPSGVTDGYVSPLDSVRMYFLFAGAVTAITARVWVRRADTGAWFVLHDFGDVQAIIPSATVPVVRDIPVGAGNEFFVQIVTISPGTAGNTITVLAEPVGSVGPQVTNTELIPVTLSDALVLPALGIPAVFSIAGDFNGATYERYRHNENRSLLVSAARTTSPASVDQPSYGGTKLIVYTNISAGGGGTGVTVIVEGKDPVSAAYYTILQSAVLTAIGFNKLIIDDQMTAVANLVGQHPLPRTWRVRNLHSDATSFTYSQSVDVVS